MTFDRIARRAALVALLFVAGCSSGPSKPATGPDGLEGQPLKVSFFRFQREQTKGRLQAVFYMMLSYGWRNRFGPVANEPFERITNNVFKNVEVADVHMETIIRAIKEKGWDALPATDVSKIDFARIRQLEKETGITDEMVGKMRWLTICDGVTTKTVGPEDAFRAGPAMHRAYIDSEIAAFYSLQAMTAKISVSADPGSAPLPHR
jgi:hypothetical protein